MEQEIMPNLNNKDTKSFDKKTENVSMSNSEQIDFRQPNKEFVPTKIQEALGSIRNKFKEVIGDFSGSKKEVVEKMKEELVSVEKEATVNGVNFAKCQMDVLTEEIDSGREFEYESFSPYLADYNMSTGEIWGNNLAKHDEIGIAIAKMLREKFSGARMISLYDEYNTNVPDSSDARGVPTPDAPQLVLDEATKTNFKKSFEELLRERGAIRENDNEGKDFLFVSETEKIQDAEKLVEMLENVPGKTYIKRKDDLITFTNPEAENPEYSEITLRTKNGRWLCEALDASSYLKKENLDKSHLVILPNHFEKQQDKVWEILRVLGIKPEHYHNIFYDENVAPEVITETIKKEIEKYILN